MCWSVTETKGGLNSGNAEGVIATRQILATDTTRHSPSAEWIATWNPGGYYSGPKQKHSNCRSLACQQFRSCRCKEMLPAQEAELAYDGGLMIGRTRGRTSLAWPLPASWSWLVPAETAACSYRRSHDLLRARSLAGGTPSWSSLQSWPPSDVGQTLWMPFVSRSENNEFETYRSFSCNPVISTNKSRHSDNRQKLILNSLCVERICSLWQAEWRLSLRSSNFNVQIVSTFLLPHSPLSPIRCSCQILLFVPELILTSASFRSVVEGQLRDVHRFELYTENPAGVPSKTTRSTWQLLLPGRRVRGRILFGKVLKV